MYAAEKPTQGSNANKFLNIDMYEKNGEKYYRPDEPFNFPEIDTRKLKRAYTDRFDYVCPHCKNIISIGFIASEEEYTVNGKEYPIYCNENLGGTMDGTYHDWEEIHCCPHCNKEFYITNGCY